MTRVGHGQTCPTHVVHVSGMCPCPARTRHGHGLGFGVSMLHWLQSLHSMGAKMTDGLICSWPLDSVMLGAWCLYVRLHVV